MKYKISYSNIIHKNGGNMTSLNNYKITKIISNIFDSEYPIFVNLYTGDNGYEKYIGKLIESLKKFNLPYYIVEIHSNGDSWEKICQQKPFLLKKVLDLYKKNIVWVDADAIIEKEPSLFKGISKSLAVHYMDKTNELNSAVLFFKNNDITKNIIKDWIEKNNTDEKLWDQRTLQEVIRKNYEEHVFKLPNEYCTIFDKGGYNQTNRVISQWQASRELKFNNRK
jgi:hypothetical protein